MWSAQLIVRLGRDTRRGISSSSHTAVGGAGACNCCALPQVVSVKFVRGWWRGVQRGQLIHPRCRPGPRGRAPPAASSATPRSQPPAPPPALQGGQIKRSETTRVCSCMLQLHCMMSGPTKEELHWTHRRLYLAGRFRSSCVPPIRRQLDSAVASNAAVTGTLVWQAAGMSGGVKANRV
jgi:hypothetical protein